MPYVLCVLSCLITKAVHSVSTEAIYLITNTLSGEEKRPPESRWTCGIAYLSSCCPYSKPISREATSGTSQPFSILAGRRFLRIDNVKLHGAERGLFVG